MGGAVAGGGGAAGAARAGVRDQLRSGWDAGETRRRVESDGFLFEEERLCVRCAPLFPTPGDSDVAPSPSNPAAEEGLASARGGAFGCVVDGGGVLLRREVRLEGEVSSLYTTKTALKTPREILFLSHQMPLCANGNPCGRVSVAGRSCSST